MENIKSELALARTILRPKGDLHIGMGFLGWQFEQPGSAPAVDLLSVALEHRVKAIWLAFGKDLGQWVQFVKSHDQRPEGDKTVVFVQVSSVQEALVAVNEWKVDCLVVQG